jgi:hypothetical protein
MSNADDLSAYSQDTTNDVVHQVLARDPIGGSGGGSNGGGTSGTGNNGRGQSSGRSKTKFGKEVDKFIPQARQLIANARADQASTIKDTLHTLDELLKKAMSMDGKNGDKGDQYQTFKNTIEELKRRTSDQPPISKHDALIGAEDAVNALDAWGSPGNPSATVSTLALGAAAAGLLLL